METIQLIALCLVVGLVVGINILLFSGVKRSSLIQGLFGDVDMFRRAGKRARNPWQDEDESLQELSTLVKILKGENDKEPEPGDEVERNSAE